MAETGKKTAAPATSGAAPTADELRLDPAVQAANADEKPDLPDESKNASLLVRCNWPHESFAVEDVPLIRQSGTHLTKEQFNKAEKAAGPSGVILSVDEGGN